MSNNNVAAGHPLPRGWGMTEVNKLRPAGEVFSRTQQVYTECTVIARNREIFSDRQVLGY
jgi:hypothetical protein